MKQQLIIILYSPGIDWGSIGTSAAKDTISDVMSTGMGLALEGHNDRRQLRQQQKLQDMQITGDKALTDYNMQKQLELWNATNYSAQMAQLSKAGLNPGLLYGKGGAGGTISNIQQGNVSGGEAPKGGGETLAMIGMGIQQRMADAQIKVAESQANLNNVKADNAAGVEKKLTETQTASLAQGIQNQQAQEALTRAQTRVQNFDADYAGATLQKRIEGLDYTVYKTRQELDILCSQAEVSRETKEAKIQQAKLEVTNLILRNVLTKAETANVNKDTQLKDSQRYLTDQEANALGQKIMQGWDGLSNQDKELRIKDMLSNYDTDQANHIAGQVKGIIDDILMYKAATGKPAPVYNSHHEHYHEHN